MLSCFSCVQLFATPRTVTCQAPLPMGFPGKNTGVGCHFLLQGIFPTQQPNQCLLGLQHWHLFFIAACMLAKLLQSCPTLCDPMDCSPAGSSVHGNAPGKNTGVGCHFLSQGIFPTQGSSPCLSSLPHW